MNGLFGNLNGNALFVLFVEHRAITGPKTAVNNLLFDRT